jgi:hypothetical protein
MLLILYYTRGVSVVDIVLYYHSTIFYTMILTLLLMAGQGQANVSIFVIQLPLYIYSLQYICKNI